MALICISPTPLGDEGRSRSYFDLESGPGDYGSRLHSSGFARCPSLRQSLETVCHAGTYRVNFRLHEPPSLHHASQHVDSYPFVAFLSGHKVSV